MEIVYGLDNWHHKHKSKGLVVALGNFDGVHLGHQRIISAALEKARDKQGTTMVATFEPHPEKVLFPEKSLHLLTNAREKASLIKALKVDILLFLDFDPHFAALEPGDFVEDILVKKLGVDEVIVGYDYRFGCKGRGTPTLLKALGEDFGFYVTVVEPVKVGGHTVSSTLIRALLKSGRVKDAAGLLGRPYAIEGRVVHGDKLGRRLGFPTANISCPQDILVPGGVFLVKCQRGQSIHYGVANVGERPTFARKGLGVEIYLFNFKGSLYGQDLRLEFLEFLRSEEEFPSPDALRRQICLDVSRAKELLRDFSYRVNRKCPQL